MHIFYCVVAKKAAAVGETSTTIFKKVEFR